MPTKVSVGLSKKAGLPNYGSVGASCLVEMELDSKILEGDPERFRLQVKRTYAACRDSVETELAQRSTTGINSNTDSSAATTAGSKAPYRRRKRTATPGQVRTIEGIASRRGINLQPILSRSVVLKAEQLSVVEASDLISELQSGDDLHSSQ